MALEAHLFNLPIFCFLPLGLLPKGLGSFKPIKLLVACLDSGDHPPPLRFSPSPSPQHTAYPEALLMRSHLNSPVTGPVPMRNASYAEREASELLLSYLYQVRAGQETDGTLKLSNLRRVE